MAAAEKRGGGHTPVPLDTVSAEQWYGSEPSTSATPESLFERRWALAVLDAAAQRLREEYESVGKGRLHGQLSPFLSREPDPGDYHRAAKVLGIQAKSVAVSVHRMRADFRAMVREEVAAGLHDKQLVEEEMRALAAALGL
jgi:RNA polymerase sigma-70 factor (ECF subfamily)